MIYVVLCVALGFPGTILCTMQPPVSFFDLFLVLFLLPSGQEDAADGPTDAAG